MGLGMGIVFMTMLALVVIIIALKGFLGKFQKTDPEAFPSGASSVSESSDDEATAALTAAIRHYQTR
jgi:sodium pump decarboxylase gamma subunit